MHEESGYQHSDADETSVVSDEGMGSIMDVELDAANLLSSLKQVSARRRRRSRGAAWRVGSTGVGMAVRSLGGGRLA